MDDGRATAPDPPGDGPVSPFDLPSAAARERVWDIALAIAAGGALGGAARYAVSSVVPSSDGGFPWATFTENALGSFLMGILTVYLMEVWPPNRYLRPFLGVGILGGFTTFSAYTSEARALLLDGEGAMAVSYLFGSVAVGLTAVVAGLIVARAIAGTSTRRGT